MSLMVLFVNELIGRLQVKFPAVPIVASVLAVVLQFRARFWARGDTVVLTGPRRAAMSLGLKISEPQVG